MERVVKRFVIKVQETSERELTYEAQTEEEALEMAKYDYWHNIFDFDCDTVDFECVRSFEDIADVEVLPE